MILLIALFVGLPGMLVLAAMLLEAQDRMRGEQRGVKRHAL